MDSLFDDTRAYIQTDYLTLEELAERAGIQPSRIEELIAKRCLPAHSYEITEHIVIRSFFGEREQKRASTRYYSPALINRARRIEEQSHHHSLPEIATSEKQTFFDRYRELLVSSGARANGFEEHFTADGALNHESLDVHLEQEWEYVLDGTYALCTSSSEVADIVTKEVMAKKIERLTKDNTRTTLNPADRAELLEAMRALDAACSQFAPDEREKSSRHHRIDRVLQRYEMKL